MSIDDLEYINMRRRQLLRMLLEFEERYSVRTSSLLSDTQGLRRLSSRGKDVEEDIKTWISLYRELVRLEEVANLSRRSRA